MLKKRVVAAVGIIAALVVISPVLYFGLVILISQVNCHRFDQVAVGETEDAVLARFGEPSVRETARPAFLRYAGPSQGCKPPCEVRLWYENVPFFMDEAWSFDLDFNRRVIDKAHWVST